MRAPLATFALLIAPLAAQHPVLVKDINTGIGGPRSSDPSHFSQPAPHILFAATRTGIGRELFVTRSTSASTHLLADLHAGPGSSDPSGFTWMHSRHYFAADDGVHGRELWASDGTLGGTNLVADVTPGPDGSDPSELLPVGRTLYFSAAVGSRRELWRSDGTTNGTVRIASFADGVRELTAFAAGVVFHADDGRTGLELWISDGTPAGTRLVRDLHPGAQPGVRRTMCVAGGKVFFTGRDPVTGWEPWCSDGTPTGTYQLADLVSGPLDSWPAAWIPIGTSALFVAGSPVGFELHISDGTAAGTRLVHDILPGPSWLGMREFTPMGGRVYFTLSHGDRGTDELWVTDGTWAGTREIAKIGVASNFHYLTAVAGRLYLTAWIGTTRGLWMSDGQSVRFVTEQAWGSHRQVDASGTRVVYASSDSDHGTELWISDLTASGTQRLADLHPGHGTLGANPAHLVDAGGVAYFVAYDQTRSGLWRTDGTEAGTQIVFAAHGARSGVSDRPLLWADDLLYLTVYEVAHGVQLWTSDGTAAGTLRRTDLGPGLDSGVDEILGVDSKGGAYFFGRLGDRSSLYRWNGSATVELQPGLAGHVIRPTTLYEVGGGTAIFAAVGWRSLWRSDGTPNGTIQVSALAGGEVSSVLGTYQDELYFGREWRNTTTLWKTDGTAAGTRQVSAIGPPPIGPLTRTVASRLLPLGDHAVYVGTKNGAVVLVRTDGTSAGTHAHGWFGATSHVESVRLAPMDGSVLAIVTPQRHAETHLWRVPSNGVVARFKIVPEFFSTSLLTRSGSRYHWFSTTERHDFVTRIWRTDGTAAGTVQVAKRDRLRVRDPLVLSSGQLLFTGYELDVGTELFRVDPGASTQPLGLTCGATLDATDPVLGSTAQLNGTVAQPNAAAVLLIGLPPSRPERFEAGCVLHVDLAAPHLALGLSLTGTSWSANLRIPALPALTGLPVIAQTLSAPGPTRLGLALSNGVVWTPGR